MNISATGGMKYSDYLGNGLSLESYYFRGEYTHGLFIADRLTFDILAGVALSASPGYYGYIVLDGGGGIGLTYYFAEKGFIPYLSVSVQADYGFLFTSKISRFILSPQISGGFLIEMWNKFYLNLKVSSSYAYTREFDAAVLYSQSHVIMANLYLGISIFIEKAK